MIRQRIHVRGWSVWVYYAVHEYYAEEIMERLAWCGMTDEAMRRTAWDNLTSGKLDTGLTFARDKRAVVVVGRASAASQYANSISHEIHHLSVFIAKAEGIELDSEEVCYIDGEIAEAMWEVTKYLTSECGCYYDLIGREL